MKIRTHKDDKGEFISLFKEDKRASKGDKLFWGVLCGAVGVLAIVNGFKEPTKLIVVVAGIVSLVQGIVLGTWPD